MFNFKSYKAMSEKNKLKITSSYFTLVVIAILVVVNILMVILGTKFTTKIDLTKSKVLDFSDTTLSVINELDKDVTIYGILEGAEYVYAPAAVSSIKEIVKKYDKLSDRITYKEIDTLSNPQFLMTYQRDGQPMGDYGVVVESGEEYRIIYVSEMYTQNSTTGYLESVMAEQPISAAIVNVTSGESINVQMVEGHGEVITSEYLTSLLTTDNYNITQTNLMTDDIAPDTDVLVVSSVKNDYIQPEIDKINAFVNDGGKLSVLMGADLNEFPVLDSFFRSWGVSFDRGVLAETTNGMYYQSQYVVIPTVQPSEITNYIIDGNLTMIVPNAASIAVTDTDNIEHTALLTSSDNSYVSTNVENTEYQEGDLKGPFNMAVLAKRTNEDKSVSEAVFSGALYSLTYQYMTAGNQNFFSNTMTYLSGNDSMLLIDAKDMSTAMLNMSPVLALVLAGIFTILVPLALIAYGVYVWIKRRHL